MAAVPRIPRAMCTSVLGESHAVRAHSIEEIAVSVVKRATARPSRIQRVTCPLADQRQKVGYVSSAITRGSARMPRSRIVDRRSRSSTGTHPPGPGSAAARQRLRRWPGGARPAVDGATCPHISDDRFSLEAAVRCEPAEKGIGRSRSARRTLDVGGTRCSAALRRALSVLDITDDTVACWNGRSPRVPIKLALWFRVAGMGARSRGRQTCGGRATRTRSLRLTDVVVVTGGAGYIGAPLCLELAASGRTVRALDVLLHGQSTVATTLEHAGVELIRADIRDAAGRERPPSAAPTPSCTWRRSSAIRPAPAIPNCSARSTSRAAGARARRGAAWREAVRVRLDLLELRPNGRPDDPRSTSRACSRRSRSTPSRRWQMEKALLGLHDARARRHLPAFRHHLWRGAADAVRPHRQRVHPRPVGRPSARGVRRAVLATVRARA